MKKTLLFFCSILLTFLAISQPVTIRQGSASTALSVPNIVIDSSSALPRSLTYVPTRTGTIRFNPTDSTQEMYVGSGWLKMAYKSKVLALTDTAATLFHYRHWAQGYLTPATGILNGTSLQTGNFNLSGNGTVGGTMQAGDFHANYSTVNVLGDLNNLRGNGDYMGYSLTNSPSGSGWVMVRNFSNGGDQIGQLAYDQYQSGKLYTRYSVDYGATWSGWKIIINSDALSGTNGYIGKFTSANSLSNSAMYESGGNIGIGTTSPAYKLDVNGVLRGQNNISLTGGDINSGFGLSLSYEALGGYVQSFGGRPLLLNALGNNVGIGTGNPTATLQVNGSVKAITSGTYVQDASLSGNITNSFLQPAGRNGTLLNVWSGHNAFLADMNLMRSSTAGDGPVLTFGRSNSPSLDSIRPSIQGNTLGRIAWSSVTSSNSMIGGLNLQANLQKTASSYITAVLFCQGQDSTGTLRNRFAVNQDASFIINGGSLIWSTPYRLYVGSYGGNVGSAFIEDSLAVLGSSIRFPNLPSGSGTTLTVTSDGNLAKASFAANSYGYLSDADGQTISKQITECNTISANRTLYLPSVPAGTIIYIRTANSSGGTFYWTVDQAIYKNTDSAPFTFTQLDQNTAYTLYWQGSQWKTLGKNHE